MGVGRKVEKWEIKNIIMYTLAESVLDLHKVSSVDTTLTQFDYYSSRFSRELL